jgi:DHA2 family multidrug resistance protein-like MFS transporter
MSAVYASGLAPALTGLPRTSADQADNSLGGALQVADGLSGDSAAALADAARAAFVSGFRVAIIVGALVLLAVALIVRLALPATDRQGESRRPDDHRLDNVEAG